MSDSSDDQSIANKTGSEFEKQASETAPGLVAEFVDFLIHNKKWWITPIVIVLLLLGLLIVLTASPIAPFIYPFF